MSFIIQHVVNALEAFVSREIQGEVAKRKVLIWKLLEGEEVDVIQHLQIEQIHFEDVVFLVAQVDLHLGVIPGEFLKIRACKEKGLFVFNDVEARSAEMSGKDEIPLEGLGALVEEGSGLKVILRLFLIEKNVQSEFLLFSEDLDIKTVLSLLDSQEKVRGCNLQ